jgi:hypothetical protein
VLATLPPKAPGEAGRRAAGEELHPLVLQQFVGAGRSMFFGFNETWRWRWREHEAHFNKFWIDTVRYLGRSRLGRIDLRLDRQTNYRRGEPIKITVRFPDDSPPPADSIEVKVLVERKPLAPARPAGDGGKGPGRKPRSGPGGRVAQPAGGARATAPVETQTVVLTKVEGSRATYEGLLTRTPDGEYQFRLRNPVVPGTPPQAQCKVLAPPGEMETLQMNRPEMERAAEETHGRFFTLADADKLLEQLPAGKRVTLNATTDPWQLWNHAGLFAVALGALTLEWILRKRKHLL